ncbi:MAG: hypothetical protein HOV79_07450 [Hamadaea sp.]|nr:hypothetical protein [Hamadaea sp.]
MTTPAPRPPAWISGTCSVLLAVGTVGVLLSFFVEFPTAVDAGAAAAMLIGAVGWLVLLRTPKSGARG